ncbi:MAG: cobalt-precorrin-6A reductase [Pseudomonadota bacterium]
MTPNLLILGGTTEAARLCQRLHEERIQGTVSLAGRVERPRDLPLRTRIGGFGGAAGLADYLRDQSISHLVDATHPFATQMSASAVEASQQTGVPLIALTRPPWTAQPGDRWTRVSGIEGAVQTLVGTPKRVMLAIGRQNLEPFAEQPQHFYLLRTVDPLLKPPAFPNHHAIVARGPFDVEEDLALMRAQAINTVVSKNAGGAAAYPKIAAARRLGLPVIMIDRPKGPPRRDVHTTEAVLDWIAHPTADLGV